MWAQRGRSWLAVSSPSDLWQMLRDKNVCFYTAQYSVHWTAQSTLHFSSPGRPVHSDTNSASLGGILGMQQLCATIIHSHFQHSHTAEWTKASWREQKCPNFETVAKGIRTRALSIVSPAFYHWATMLHTTKHDLPRNPCGVISYCH